MKTPHAILIGLSLIAAAIFFEETAVKPAHANEALDARYGYKTVGFDCLEEHRMGLENRRWTRDGYQLYMFERETTTDANPRSCFPWVH